MSRLLLLTIVILGVGLAAPVSDFNRGADGVGSEVGGKYLTETGGYLRFSIDDFGRVQGYYERDGRFGEISGHFDGRAVHGFWLEDGGEAVCGADRAGFDSWGRVSLRFDSAGEFEGTYGRCDATPESTWSGRRN